MTLRWLTLVLGMIFAIATLAVGCDGGDGPSFSTVLETDPENREMGVHLEARVFAQLDANVDADTLSTQTFFLEDIDGARVPGAVSVADDPAVIEFAPDEPLSVLTTYVATVTTGLLDVSGRPLAGDFTWSFTTLDLAWGVAETIEALGTGDANWPQIAVDAQSRAVAVWQQFDGVRETIFANRFNRADLWGEPEPIDAGTGTAINPRLAMNDNGDAFAAWEQGGTIWGNRMAMGGAWEQAEQIQTDVSTSGRGPDIAVDPAGNAIVIWEQTDEVTRRETLKFNRYAAGMGWGVDDFVEPPTVSGNIARGAEVEVDASGNAIAVWTFFNRVRAARFTPATGWAEPEFIEDPEVITSFTPSLAMNADGEAVVAWERDDPGETSNIWANRFSPDSGWATAELIETNDTGDAETPNVGLNPAGEAFVVWSHSDGTFHNIWANRHLPGSGWEAPELIEQPPEDPGDDGDAREPKIGVGPEGSALVVWTQPFEVWNSIWSNRFTVDAGWQVAEPIELLNRPAGIPQIAVDQNRHAHAVWRHSDGFLDRIRTNRFE